MRYDATPECIAAGGQADYHSGTLETPTGGVCYANGNSQYHNIL